jgi:hypothetical protein
MSAFTPVPPALFRLGRLAITSGVARLCTVDYLTDCLLRHATGDWGCVANEDAAENNLAVATRRRLFSAYPIDPDKPCMVFGNNCLWVITKADRSVTTLRLPSES